MVQINADGYCAPARVELFRKTGSCLLKDEVKSVSNKTCKDDLCVLQNPRTKHKLQHAFRPVMPGDWIYNDREWLSTDDIVAVLKQYEDAYKDFRFLGVHPINFEEEKYSGVCIGRSICNVNDLMYNNKKNGIKQFGIVFNLDRHDQGGSHWVCIYCGLDPTKRTYGIYYYDSIAMFPRIEFQNFMTKIQSYVYKNIMSRDEKPFPKQINKDRRQFKTTECGMFCMLFIIACIENGHNMHFREVCKCMKDDDWAQMYRSILYLPQK